MHPSPAPSHDQTSTEPLPDHQRAALVILIKLTALLLFVILIGVLIA